MSGTSPGPAIARTTFRITRPPSAFKNPLEDEDDIILKYGQPFCLASNESLRYGEGETVRDPDLYLSSTLKNERNATKGSNRQCVYLSAAQTSDAVWFCMRPSRGRDPKSERTMAIGHPIYADDSFVFTHHSSNTFLKADRNVKEYTDFGVEAELSTEKSASIGKLGIVISEQSGQTAAGTLTKPDVPSNLWHFQYSDNPATAVERRCIPEKASVDGLLKELRRQILSSGIFGMVHFRRQVLSSISGYDGAQTASSITHREDARIALINAGCELKDTRFGQIMDSFDPKKSGYVDILVILEHIAKLSDDEACDYQSRESLVSAKFRELLGGKKSITVSELMERFRPEELPFVKSGEYTSEEAMEAFRAAFPVPRKKHVAAPALNQTQFSGFFADIGASIPDDEYFGYVVTSCLF